MEWQAGMHSNKQFSAHTVLVGSNAMPAAAERTEKNLAAASSSREQQLPIAVQRRSICVIRAIAPQFDLIAPAARSPACGPTIVFSKFGPVQLELSGAISEAGIPSQTTHGLCHCEAMTGSACRLSGRAWRRRGGNHLKSTPPLPGLGS